MTKTNHGWNLASTYTQLRSFFYTEAAPQEVPAPEMVLWNRSLARELGLDENALFHEPALFAGAAFPSGAVPISQAYAGHQFGNFTMLGDGRAVLLGEQQTPEGQLVDIQLKGSGRTAYSRSGDGRAGLGPMLREYVISEAMHALGIPTSRSLAVAKTGEPVYREKPLEGAVLTRTASSHLRVGTFQYARAAGSIEDVEQLADYAIKRHDPEAGEAPNPYLAFLRGVIQRQAALTASWQLTGFIHGVMNTDNMTISGETIDYGPCAFMDTYDPETVFSSIDTGGRYAYKNQPYIAAWNLSRLAEAILPLLDDDEEAALNQAQKEITAFTPLYQQYWRDGMSAKLGLASSHPGDDKLFEDLLAVMEAEKADFTNTFRALALDPEEDELLGGTFSDWHLRWEERLQSEGTTPAAASQRMRQVNPAVIPRNHLVEEALAAAVDQGDMGPFHELLQVLSNPYADIDPDSRFCRPAPASAFPFRTYCGT
ncbi:protein adenylyltransferase SelO [Alkalicoccus urumqiensis]|uniref:Protein nucleotidyltransferase YdiU n=1 Tax=Alkalicoccus urumqiensis TaxID=1548213 RepID=A0A2P6MLD3_ALKUR|nr:YdiU family protein [Alkalicoccus urumqiensis]PRO67088.1 YdiU family protein [Alkalicoccus urumqiensis]